MAIIHKLLFAQRIRVKNGEILSGIAKQIERLYGQVEDVSLECLFHNGNGMAHEWKKNKFYFHYRNQSKGLRK